MTRADVRGMSPRLDRRRLLLAALAAGIGGRAARAEFAAGSTMRLLVSTGPGSADDLMNRLFARYLEKYLGGVSVVPETMPKGNPPLMASRLWEAPPDGLTLGFPSQSLLLGALAGDAEGLPFDYFRFQWIGSLAEESRVLLVSEASGIRSVDDLLARRSVLAAASSITSSHFYEALLINALLGTRIKSVAGYTGSGRPMAVIGGEAEAFIGSLESASTIVDAGAGRVLLRLAGAPLPPPYDQVPQLSGLALRPDLGWIVDLMEAEARVGRLLAAPPTLPGDILQYLRDVFLKVAADPAFVREAAEQQLQVAAVAGSEIQARLDLLLPYGADGGKAFKAVLACGERLGEGGAC